MRQLTNYEIWTVLYTERKESIFEEKLSENEIDDYLLIIEAEIHQTWIIFDYYSYWKNYY